MIAQDVFFWIFAVSMAIGAIRVVTTNNIVHAALWLVLVLGGAAAQFLLLGQEFIAWVQVIVYIGAVIVLFLFGIMLTHAPMQAHEKMGNDLRLVGLGVSLLVGGTLAWVLVDEFGSDKVHLARPVHTAEVDHQVMVEVHEHVAKKA